MDNYEHDGSLELVFSEEDFSEDSQEILDTEDEDTLDEELGEESEEESDVSSRKPSGYWSRKIVQAVIALDEGEGCTRSEINQYISDNLKDDLMTDDDREDIRTKTGSYIVNDLWIVDTGERRGR